MSLNTGPKALVRESSTYAAVNTWYQTSSFQLQRGADTIRLWLDAADGDPGQVTLQIQVSQDDATWYDIEMGVYYGPIMMSDGDSISYSMSCAPLISGDYVRLSFLCTEGAGAAKLRIKAHAYKNGADKLCPHDLFLDVSRGLIPHASMMHKFGRTGSLALNTDTDVWSYSATAPTYTFSSTADIDSVSSSSAVDTGVHVLIQGLDENWDYVEQTATLAGQTRVALATPLIRVFRGYNSNSVDFAGDIYVYPNTALTAGQPTDTAKVRLHIPVGANQTLTSIYTVPRGQNAFVYSMTTSIANKAAASVEIEASSRIYGKVWRIQNSHAINSAGSGTHHEFYNMPLMFPEKTDFRISVNSSANASVVSVNYDILLVENR